MNSNNEILIQFAQKCPWCDKYLLAGQPTNLYNGNDIRFNGWISHVKCNNITLDKIKSKDENMVK